MSQVIIMPKLGLTMTHGRITRWAKKVGDPVKAGETVVEIETDKINSEVEAPADGFILKILAEEGEEKEITAPICVVGEKGEFAGEITESENKKPEAAAAGRIFITPIARMLARENKLDYSGIKATGPGGRIVKKDILRALEERSGKQADPVLEADDAGIRISPVAKRIAQENGIDCRNIKGTGPDGRIVKEDILTNVKKIPLTGIRKVIARRLSQSKHDIPHVYFKISVDAGGIIELKNRLAGSVKGKTGKKLSLNDIIVKAAAVALDEFPDMNVSLVDDEIIYNNEINIGIAVNSERGLVVPVVKNAGKKSLSEICKNTGELIDRAWSGKLTHEDMSGGTFTISNLGAYHIDEFSAIINPPESAILAVGRASETPCVRNGEIVIRPVMNLTVSVDHRVIDGALAAQFMKRLKDIMEDPYLLLI